MRKRISPTIMERAVAAVPAFKHVVRKLDEQVTLRGQSPGTLHNYSQRIALFFSMGVFCLLNYRRE